MQRFSHFCHVRYPFPFGHLPKYDEESAQAWLYGKLLVALLVEKVVRHALTISPWGYDVQTEAGSQPVA